MYGNWIATALLLVGVQGCVTSEVVPLVGEDAEVARLLQQQPAPDPQTSPEATARRLYLALSQGDYELSWALLSQKARDLLTKRAALAGTTGPELLQSNSLPQDDGQVIKVNYVSVFFGNGLQRLRVDSASAQGPDLRRLIAVSESGDAKTLEFLREPDGWKLNPTTL